MSKHDAGHQRGLSWSSITSCLVSSRRKQQEQQQPQTPKKQQKETLNSQSCTPLTPGSSSSSRSKSAAGLVSLMKENNIVARKLVFDEDCNNNNDVCEKDSTLDGLCRRVSKLSINHRCGKSHDGNTSCGKGNGKVERKISKHGALMIPEIVHEILYWVEAIALIPYEPPPIRRRPLSYQHALLIHGDEEVARRAWIEAKQEQVHSGSDTSYKRYRIHEGQHCLYNSLLVCRLWYDIGQPLLYEHIHLCTSREWNKFIRQVIFDKAKSLDDGFDGTGKCKGDILHLRGRQSKLLILHKIADANQDQIEILNHIGKNLEWLEFYTCPNIIPSRELLSGGLIKRLVLPGCDGVDDRFLSMVGHLCNGLEILDIRACNLVSDRGIASISRHCPRLKMLNVGRTSCGERITTRGVKYLVRRTNINTLGLAGCYITDEAIWEIVKYRGNFIERLSLNHCYLLTDLGIPRALKFFKNLTVLELRSCIQITDMIPIVEFKLSFNNNNNDNTTKNKNNIPLIEGCEIFESRMRQAEWRYHSW